MSSLIFTPTLIIQGTRYELPRPIVAFRLLDAWDSARFKVPLKAGDLVLGRSQDGVDVVIEGRIGTQAGVLQATETDMFLTLEQLRLSAAQEADPNSVLVLYRNDSQSQEHFLRGCSIQRCEYDLSDMHLFTYSMVIHATDPQLYLDAPL